MTRKRQNDPSNVPADAEAIAAIAASVEEAKQLYALDDHRTILIPITTDPDTGAIIEQKIATLPADKLPKGAVELGVPAPIQEDGSMVLVSSTGGIAYVPAADLVDYPGFARAVAEVHF